MAVSLCVAGASLCSREAAAGSLPQEFLGFRLGEKIEPVGTSSWGVTIKSRTMVAVNDSYFGAPPPGPDVIIYRDCPVRLADRCASEPKPEDVPGDRPDEPGSVALFVTRFGEPKLLGLAFKLNPRGWRRSPLEKAAESLGKTYGNPVKVSPPRREVQMVQPTGWRFVSAFASWQWQDSVVRLHVAGTGTNLPGSFGNPDPSYSYLLYAERVDLRRLADELAERRRAKVKEQ